MNSKHLRRLLALAAGLVAATLAGSAAVPPPEPSSALAPRVVALGTVQDAGLPQPGCTCERCAAARRDPARRRYVASLALVVPRSGHTWLIDATPDLPAQIDRIQTWRPHPQGRPDRAPVDGVLLTHAHIGHYLGLALFGFEAIDTRELPVYASPRMGAFLRANGPWSQLVGKRNIALREFRPGEPFVLDAGVTVTPIAVPHRDEFTDTMAFLVRGPRRSLLYVPDTDGWASWPRAAPRGPPRRRRRHPRRHLLLARRAARPRSHEDQASAHHRHHGPPGAARPCRAAPRPLHPPQSQQPGARPAGRGWWAGHEREVIGELADASTPPWSEVRPAW